MHFQEHFRLVVMNLMRGIFPKVFPKRQLPKGIFPSGNLIAVQLPKSILALSLFYPQR